MCEKFQQSCTEFHHINTNCRNKTIVWCWVCHLWWWLGCAGQHSVGQYSLSSADDLMNSHLRHARPAPAACEQSSRLGSVVLQHRSPSQVADYQRHLLHRLENPVLPGRLSINSGFTLLTVRDRNCYVLCNRRVRYLVRTLYTWLLDFDVDINKMCCTDVWNCFDKNTERKEIRNYNRSCEIYINT